MNRTDRIVIANALKLIISTLLSIVQMQQFGGNESIDDLKREKNQLNKDFLRWIKENE